MLNVTKSLKKNDELLKNELKAKVKRSLYDELYNVKQTTIIPKQLSTALLNNEGSSIRFTINVCF